MTSKMELQTSGLVFTYLSKVFLIYAEHEIQLRRVILQDPLQGVVVFTVLQEIKIKQGLKIKTLKR